MKKTITLRNNRDSVLTLTLEPWVHIYEVPEGKQVDLECDLEEGKIDFEIIVEPDNCLNVYVPYETRVLLDGQVLHRL
jgi:hypothetical protein